jgi:enediyne biosynthesis protein E4
MDAKLSQRRNAIRHCTFRRERIASMKVARATALLLLLPATVLPSPLRSKASAVVFTDITKSADILWKQVSGASVRHFLPETMGGGVGFLDFDHDGLLDIFLVTGGETANHPTDQPARNALYRNLGNGRFEEVAQKAGVDRNSFYGLGVAAADYDDDGFPDLYITGYPRSALWHNNRDGTFTDVTDKAGVANEGKFAASAAWFDYDRDGLLDLFVTNYVKFSYDLPLACSFEGIPTYCAQKAYQGDVPTLYHNNGDGTFTDVTARAGLSQLAGRALGVVAIDVDGDGWQDLFVSRDASPNLLLMNKHDGTFEDRALDADVAFNLDGNALSGMGVDAGDFTGNGFPGFVVTNFSGERHSLFVNAGRFPFVARTLESAVGSLTMPYVGWGVQFTDYNNSGLLALLIANGHIYETIEKQQPGITYREPPLLLANSGDGEYRDMKEAAGTAFQQRLLGRGLATGDIDNDGRTDAIITRLNDSPVLLRNTWQPTGSWIGFELEGTRSNRDAIGAKVTLSLPKRKLVRWVTGGSSYLSTHDKRVLVGLGSETGAVSAEIHWPSGQVQQLTGMKINQYHHILEPK